MPTIKLRGGTAAEWTTANPVLASREPGVETDTGKIKVGDGSTVWASLPYSAGGSGGGGSDVTLDADGTLTVDGVTVEVALDSDVAGLATTVSSLASSTTSALAGKLSTSGTAADAVKVGGITVTGSPSTGHVIKATSSTAATWQADATGGGGGGAVSSVVGQTGDVTGTQIVADTTVAAALTAKADASTTTTALAGKADATATTTALAGKAATDFSNVDATTGRTALGLGTAAERGVGTSSGTVAAGDDSRITGAAQKSANLSDLASPSTALTNLGAAPLASPTFTGTPIVPTTPTVSGQAASKGYVDTQAAAAAAAGTAYQFTFYR